MGDFAGGQWALFIGGVVVILLYLLLVLVAVLDHHSGGTNDNELVGTIFFGLIICGVVSFGLINSSFGSLERRQDHAQAVKQIELNKTVDKVTDLSMKDEWVEYDRVNGDACKGNLIKVNDHWFLAHKGRKCFRIDD